MLLVKAQEKNLDKNSIQTIIGKIDIRDIKCLSEIKKAKQSFKHIEILYDIIPEGYIDSDYKRHYPYLKKLLKEKGIDFYESHDFDSSSFWMSDGESKYTLVTNCYCKASNELLNLKYGTHFIRDIKKSADSLYVMSRIDIPFDYPFGVDNYCMIYPKAGDFFDQKLQIQKDFFSYFVLPKNFIQSNEKRDFFAKTKFRINKDNSISNITVDIEFKNRLNEEFYNLIADQIINFIKNADWTAAVSNNIKVNSNFNINFYN